MRLLIEIKYSKMFLFIIYVNMNEMGLKKPMGFKFAVYKCIFINGVIGPWALCYKHIFCV